LVQSGPLKAAKQGGTAGLAPRPFQGGFFC
jgi:hypothetical protein